MKIDLREIIQKVRDLRDNTPCLEDSHKHCGCEKFDEIIDDLIRIHYAEKSKKVKDIERLNDISKKPKVDNLYAMQNFAMEKLFKALIEVYKKENN
jgi:hypothetical protein